MTAVISRFAVVAEWSRTAAALGPGASVQEWRAARRSFMAAHAEAVYDALTGARVSRLRLPELVAAAADAFPGLLPSPAEMASEAALNQAEKQGKEIDQAIFCAAVLRSPPAGHHLIDTMLMATPAARELLAGFRATGRLDLEAVRIRREGEAAFVTMHNPRSLNAEDSRMIRDLEIAVDLVLLNDQIRVGVLRGGPVDHPKYRGDRIFSAGINLKELRAGNIPFVDFLLGRELGYVNKLLRGMVVDPAREAWTERAVHKPWIGVVDSFAVGGGMQLLLVLDRVIAEAGAWLSLPAAEEGIIPGLSNLRLTRAVGTRLSRQIVLGGCRLPVSDPRAALICDEVLPADDVDAAVDEAVRALSAPAVAANRSMLAVAEEPIDQFRSYLAEFAVTQAERAYSEDVLVKAERWR